MAALNLIGQQFHYLTVKEKGRIEKKPKGTVHFWICKCKCGKVCEYSTGALRSGKSKSCGCYRIEMAANRVRTHGRSKSKAYELWGAMIQRCRGNRHQSYVRKGISCCPEWESFENFLRDMGEPKQGESLERIDNAKGYSRENCKWIPMGDQWRNRDRQTLYEYQGRSMSLREISEICGVPRATLQHRVKVQKLTLEEAVKNEPVKLRPKCGNSC
jgi:hypothetical protein